MLTTYRIFSTAHSARWQDGQGSFLYGGRWNSIGVRVLYSAGNLSLAALEMLVYLDDEEMIGDYSWATIEFDEQLVVPVESVTSLDSDWKDVHSRITTQAIGDNWVTSMASAVLRVPTALLPVEFNYVINLAHPDASKIRFGKIDRFIFDERFDGKEPEQSNL